MVKPVNPHALPYHHLIAETENDVTMGLFVRSPPSTVETVKALQQAVLIFAVELQARLLCCRSLQNRVCKSFRADQFSPRAMRAGGGLILSCRGAAATGGTALPHARSAENQRENTTPSCESGSSALPCAKRSTGRGSRPEREREGGNPTTLGLRSMGQRNQSE